MTNNPRPGDRLWSARIVGHTCDECACLHVTHRKRTRVWLCAAPFRSHPPSRDLCARIISNHKRIIAFAHVLDAFVCLFDTIMQCVGVRACACVCVFDCICVCVCVYAMHWITIFVELLFAWGFFVLSSARELRRRRQQQRRQDDLRQAMNPRMVIENTRTSHNICLLIDTLYMHDCVLLLFNCRVSKRVRILMLKYARTT